MSKEGFYTHTHKTAFYSNFIQMFGIPHPFSKRWLELELGAFTFHPGYLRLDQGERSIPCFSRAE